jgi:hypothetical protein
VARGRVDRKQEAIAGSQLPHPVRPNRTEGSIMKKTALFAASLAMAASAFSLCMDAAAAEGKPRSERGRLVHQIVMKWGNHVQETYRSDVRNWTGAMAPTFAKAKIDTLQRAANATTFDTMNDLLLADGNAPAPVQANSRKTQITARSLGDASTDLVFVPVSPCRLFDTRVIGGAIAANTVRSFDVTAVSDYSFQGGSASNCNGVGAAGSFAAAVINLVAVTPSGAGYLTAFPFGGTQPNASNVNYTAGSVVANLATVALDQGASANEMSIYSFAQTHVVGDIVGYFINPQATALQCVETANTDLVIAAGGTGNSVAPACAAGYTQTSTNCESSTWQMPFVYFQSGTCSAQNNSGGNATLRASRTCCRVPGR